MKKQASEPRTSSNVVYLSLVNTVYNAKLHFYVLVFASFLLQMGLTLDPGGRVVLSQNHEI